jgi:Ser/Thr protein kinase RdoA (MazF antagonist)
MSASTREREAHLALTAWASIVDDGVLTPMAQVTNPLWLVESFGSALVLKQLPQYPPGVEPVAQFRVLSHLQAHGVPVALPTLTDQGTLHATVNDRQWVLLPYLEHRPSSPELGPDAPSVAFAIGTAIGRLDRALAAYPWPVKSYVDDPTKTITRALLELPPEAVEIAGPFADILSDRCAGLPVQLTHGDCNDGNVLLNHDQLVGIIDIDHLPTGPRVRDLAYYLGSRLRRYLEWPNGAIAAATMVDVLGDYVAGYHQIHPLTEQELRAIVPLMLLVEIGGAHWALHGWEPDRDTYQRNLRSITWIIHHFRALAQAAQTP